MFDLKVLLKPAVVYFYFQDRAVVAFKPLQRCRAMGIAKLRDDERLYCALVRLDVQTTRHRVAGDVHIAGVGVYLRYAR